MRGMGKYILPLSNRMVEHILLYWPNVGKLSQSNNLTYPPKLVLAVLIVYIAICNFGQFSRKGKGSLLIGDQVSLGQ